MNLLAVTTVLQLIQGLAPGRPALLLIALLLIVLAVMAIALMFRHLRRGRLLALVVGTCVMCAFLFLVVSSDLRLRRRVSHGVVCVLQDGRGTVIEGPVLPPDQELGEQFVVYPAPGHVEATTVLDEEGDLLVAQSAVRSADPASAPGRPRLPPEPRTPNAPGRQPGPQPDQARLPLPWTIVSAIALAAMVYLAYLFLDAGTRGQFTWPLRVFSVVAFVGICVLLVLYGRGF